MHICCLRCSLLFLCKLIKKRQHRSNLLVLKLVSMVIQWAQLIQMLLNYLTNVTVESEFHF